MAVKMRLACINLLVPDIRASLELTRRVVVPFARFETGALALFALVLATWAITGPVCVLYQVSRFVSVEKICLCSRKRLDLSEIARGSPSTLIDCS